MKKLIFLILLLFSPTILALDSCHTGSWYDPAIPAEGISLEVMPDGYVVAYFYTYDGFDAQTWYLFQGPDAEDLMAVDILDRSPEDIGSGYIVAVDNDNLIFGWDFVLDLDVLAYDHPIPWCLNTLCEGTRKYSRLTQPVPCP